MHRARHAVHCRIAGVTVYVHHVRHQYHVPVAGSGMARIRDYRTVAVLIFLARFREGEASHFYARMDRRVTPEAPYWGGVSSRSVVTEAAVLSHGGNELSRV